MANLTKELKKLVKQKIDPIHEELFEQFQAAQFHRQMAKFRNEEFVDVVFLLITRTNVEQ